MNSIIYSAALPFICEIKQKLNKLYVAKYYCYSHVISPLYIKEQRTMVICVTCGHHLCLITKETA